MTVQYVDFFGTAHRTLIDADQDFVDLDRDGTLVVFYMKPPSDSLSSSTSSNAFKIQIDPPVNPDKTYVIGIEQNTWIIASGFAKNEMELRFGVRDTNGNFNVSYSLYVYNPQKYKYTVTNTSDSKGYMHAAPISYAQFAKTIAGKDLGTEPNLGLSGQMLIKMPDPSVLFRVASYTSSGNTALVLNNKKDQATDALYTPRPVGNGATLPTSLDAQSEISAREQTLAVGKTSTTESSDPARLVLFSTMPTDPCEGLVVDYEVESNASIKTSKKPHSFLVTKRPIDLLNSNWSDAAITTGAKALKFVSTRIYEKIFGSSEGGGVDKSVSDLVGCTKAYFSEKTDEKKEQIRMKLGVVVDEITKAAQNASISYLSTERWKKESLTLPPAVVDRLRTMITDPEDKYFSEEGFDFVKDDSILRNMLWTAFIPLMQEVGAIAAGGYSDLSEPILTVEVSKFGYSLGVLSNRYQSYLTMYWRIRMAQQVALTIESKAASMYFHKNTPITWRNIDRFPGLDEVLNPSPFDDITKDHAEWSLILFGDTYKSGNESWMTSQTKENVIVRSFEKGWCYDWWKRALTEIFEIATEKKQTNAFSIVGVAHVPQNKATDSVYGCYSVAPRDQIGHWYTGKQDDETQMQYIRRRLHMAIGYGELQTTEPENSAYWTTLTDTTDSILSLEAYIQSVQTCQTELESIVSSAKDFLLIDGDSEQKKLIRIRRPEVIDVSVWNTFLESRRILSGDRDEMEFRHSELIDLYQAVIASISERPLPTELLFQHYQRYETKFDALFGITNFKEHPALLQARNYLNAQKLRKKMRTKAESLSKLIQDLDNAFSPMRESAVEDESKPADVLDKARDTETEADFISGAIFKLLSSIDANYNEDEDIIRNPFLVTGIFLAPDPSELFNVIVEEEVRKDELYATPNPFSEQDHANVMAAYKAYIASTSGEKFISDSTKLDIDAETERLITAIQDGIIEIQEDATTTREYEKLVLDIVRIDTRPFGKIGAGDYEYSDDTKRMLEDLHKRLLKVAKNSEPTTTLSWPTVFQDWKNYEKLFHDETQKAKADGPPVLKSIYDTDTRYANVWLNLFRKIKQLDRSVTDKSTIMNQETLNRFTTAKERVYSLLNSYLPANQKILPVQEQLHPGLPLSKSVKDTRENPFAYQEVPFSTIPGLSDPEDLKILLELQYVEFIKKIDYEYLFFDEAYEAYCELGMQNNADLVR